MKKQTKVFPLNATSEHLFPMTNRVSNSFQRQMQDIQIRGVRTQSTPNIFHQPNLNQICTVCQKNMKSTFFCKVSRSCQHFYCQACVIKYIEYMIEQYRQPKCLSQDCQQIIECRQEVGLAYQRLTRAKKIKLHKILQTFEQLKTQRCKGCLVGKLVSVVDQNQQKALTCPNCKINTCIKCLNLAHPGQACQKRKSKLPQGFQVCPKCACIIERTKGCVHIKCICGQNFCFQCGKRWTNGHVCEKDFVHRQGLRLIIAIILKSLLFPFVLLFLLGFFLFFGLGTCLVSSLIFGCLVGSKILSFLRLQKEQSSCLSCCKLISIIGIFIMFPLIWIIMLIPGFIIPIINICWDQKITLDPDVMGYLLREFRDYIIAFCYL